MIPGRPRCSAESLAREEPLFATASLVDSWLLIEQPGAWGPDALADSGFPFEHTTPLLSEAERLRIRVLLIRRRSTQGRDLTVFLAHSGGNGRPPVIRAGAVTEPSELIDLDLEALARGRPPDFGAEVDHPIYLVCTHGRHDICCADRGRPLFRSLSEHRPDQTWEVSHVGGDRFAGNLVVLPRGDYFGRVEGEAASGLVDLYESGRLDLRHHRGRSSQPRMVQAAEHFLRESLHLAGFNDVEVVDYRRSDPHHAEVVFLCPDGGARSVVVGARSLPDGVYLTCGAANPGFAVAYDLLSIESG